MAVCSIIIILSPSSLPPVYVEEFQVVDVSEPEPYPRPREMPPYNGFGSPEDSLASCLNLIPKAPRRYAPCFLPAACDS